MEAGEARERLRAFVQRRPEYRVDGELYSEQGYNSWVFKGTYRDRPALFKVSRRGAAGRERSTLERFAGTGLVPCVYGGEDSWLLVMEFVAGEPWGTAISRREPGWERTVESVAEATARFVGHLQDPEHAAGLDPAFLRRNLAVTLDTAQQVLALNRDLYADDVFPRTLEYVLPRQELLTREPSSLYWDDLPQCLVHRGRFSRFYDLESVYQGTLHLQVGALVAALADPRGRAAAGPGVLDAFFRRLAATLPLDDERVLAGALLKTWIRIARFSGWNGWPPWQPVQLLASAENPDGERQRASRFAEQLIGTLTMSPVARGVAGTPPERSHAGAARQRARDARGPPRDRFPIPFPFDQASPATNR
jgi:hypothetical protein